MKPKKLPVVMSHNEIRKVLQYHTGDKWLIAKLLHSSGMRLTEYFELRVQDGDFSQNQILICDGKGSKDRRIMLPESLKTPLQENMETSKG